MLSSAHQQVLLQALQGLRGHLASRGFYDTQVDPVTGEPASQPSVSDLLASLSSHPVLGGLLRYQPPQPPPPSDVTNGFRYPTPQPPTPVDVSHGFRYMPGPHPVQPLPADVTNGFRYQAPQPPLPTDAALGFRFNV